LVAHDQTKKAASSILNFIDSEYKIWSKEKQDEVASNLGDIAYNIDSIGRNFKKAGENAFNLDGSSFKTKPVIK